MSRRALSDGRLNRRSLLAGSGAFALSAALPVRGEAQTASPVASPVAEEWSFTDVTGKTVRLPRRPVKIAAYINQGASLWDFGIQPATIFGWTASNFPDGDHIAWGNIDLSAIEIISDVEGNVDLEKLLLADPDLIVTWTWNKNDPTNATNGFPADVLGRAEQIAPIVILNQGDPDDIELARVEALAEALGADLKSSALVADRDALAAKVAEVKQVAAEKADLTVIFASYGVPGIYYVASPDYVADLGYLRSLGVKLANDGSPTATVYWEEISTEEALKYPSDLVYLDSYGAWNTLEQVRADPTIRLHPAIAAGQVGYWYRDFPLSYSGLTSFLEDVLAPMRTAKKVS